jgi:hypothetical protein
MYFDDFLKNACDSIIFNQSQGKKNISKLLHIRDKVSPNGVEKFVLNIESKNFSGDIAGVDSGFVSKRLNFVELLLLKIGGVVFSFEDSVLKKAAYFPSPVLLPKPILLKNFLEADEESQSISFERLKCEVENSIQIIEKYSPKYLFVDGSIVPQYQDKPRTDSILNKDYVSIIDLFEKFYSVAEKNNCTIISTVEDSRGKRFIQILESLLNKNDNSLDLENINFSNFSDSLFLDHFLKLKERTFCFKYTSDISKHAILKDYKKEWSENIFVFYLKASDFDLPLRIEFISKKEPFELVNEIASIVFSLSSIHKEYSYPSVLIEADLRARLNEQEINTVFNRLVDKLGSKVKLRRNSRPF